MIDAETRSGTDVQGDSTTPNGQTGTVVPMPVRRRVTGEGDAPLNEARSDRAYHGIRYVGSEDRPDWTNFYAPNRAMLDDYADEIAWAIEVMAHVIVPMHESSTEVVAVLEYLTSRVKDPSRIVVVNSNSTRAAVRAVHEFNRRQRKAESNPVHFVDQEKILNILDWKRLLPILGLKHRPTRGKGLAVLAGTIAMRLLHPSAAAVIQHDADVSAPASYLALEHIMLPIAIHKRASEQAQASGSPKPERPDYIRCITARPDRGNETVMTARNMFRLLSLTAFSSFLDRDFQRWVDRLWKHMVELKWMLTGEFGARGDVAYGRPFATGYGEETLYALYVAERIIALNGNQAVAQIEACSARRDDVNDDRKEVRMQDILSKIMLAYVLFRHEHGPIHEWTLETYKVFNETVMFELNLSGRIPCRVDEQDASSPCTMSGRVCIEDNTNCDRFFPPIPVMEEAEIICEEASRRLCADPFNVEFIQRTEEAPESW